jgi:hypothetical protein
VVYFYFGVDDQGWVTFTLALTMAAVLLRITRFDALDADP